MLSSEYVAGLFDGEGCFCISKATNQGRDRRLPFYYRATAAIEIREEFIIDELVAKYGGSKVFKRSRNERHSDMFIWKVGADNLKMFCYDMQDKLRLKATQCQLILDFLKIREGRNTSPITDKEVEEQEAVRRKLQLSNERGINRQLVPNNVVSG